MSKVVGYAEKSMSRIKMFNELCGNLENVDRNVIAGQLDRIQEEYIELVEELDLLRDEAMLKETIDLHVAVGGLLVMFEAAGFKVAEAMERVDLNNLSKYPKFGDPTLPIIVADAESKGYTVTAHSGYGVYSLKDSNNKVRKPITYKSVEISDCAVAGFLEAS